MLHTRTLTPLMMSASIAIAGSSGCIPLDLAHDVPREPYTVRSLTHESLHMLDIVLQDSATLRELGIASNDNTIGVGEEIVAYIRAHVEAVIRDSPQRPDNALARAGFVCFDRNDQVTCVDAATLIIEFQYPAVTQQAPTEMVQQINSFVVTVVFDRGSPRSGEIVIVDEFGAGTTVKRSHYDLESVPKG